MKKALNIFFVSLGVLFLVILLAVGYIYITDTYGIRSLLNNSNATDVVNEGEVQVSDDNPLISDSQEVVLKKVGIDPAKLPSNITAEMEVCFEDKLGADRAQQIKDGDSPTATDFFKTQDCF